MKSHLLWLVAIAFLGLVATGALIQGRRSTTNNSTTREAMAPAETMENASVMHGDMKSAHAMGGMHETMSPNGMAGRTANSESMRSGGMTDKKAKTMVDGKTKPSM